MSFPKQKTLEEFPGSRVKPDHSWWKRDQVWQRLFGSKTWNTSQIWELNQTKLTSEKTKAGTVLFLAPNRWCLKIFTRVAIQHLHQSLQLYNAFPFYPWLNKHGKMQGKCWILRTYDLDSWKIQLCAMPELWNHRLSTYSTLPETWNPTHRSVSEDCHFWISLRSGVVHLIDRYNMHISMQLISEVTLLKDRFPMVSLSSNFFNHLAISWRPKLLTIFWGTPCIRTSHLSNSWDKVPSYRQTQRIPNPPDPAVASAKAAWGASSWCMAHVNKWILCAWVCWIPSPAFPNSWARPLKNFQIHSLDLKHQHEQWLDTNYI